MSDAEGGRRAGGARPDYAEVLRSIAPRPAAPVPLRLPLDALPTPFLALDLDVFEANLSTMAEACAAAGLALRPHGKMHRCPEVAKRQIARGAAGVCAAKPAEAEAFVRAGVTSVLLTSPIVQAPALERMLALMDQAEIRFVVDGETGLEAIERAASAHGVVAQVLLDVDPDMGRTGVPRDERGLRLAARIAGSAHLRLLGVQQYCGHLMHIGDHGERREALFTQARRGRDFVAALEDRGIAVTVRTGGGTGSFDMEAEAGLLNEIQAGSYAFMDREYGELGFGNGRLFDCFGAALTVHATVISAPRQGAVTLDAGIKSLATDTVGPVPCGAHASLKYRFAGDEHGVLQASGDGRLPLPGERVELLVPHCDPTVNLYDALVVRRDQTALALWPVSARGGSW